MRRKPLRMRFNIRADWGQQGSYMVVSPSHGQTIQTGAFFCDDGSGGVHRVWRDGILHSSRGSRQNSGGTGGLLDRRKSGRASAAWRKVADGR